MNINGIEINRISRELDKDKLIEEYGYFENIEVFLKDITEIDIGLCALVKRYGSVWVVSIVCVPYQNFEVSVMNEYGCSLNMKEIEDLYRLMKILRHKSIDYMDTALSGGKDCEHFKNSSLLDTSKILGYIQEEKSS